MSESPESSPARSRLARLVFDYEAEDQLQEASVKQAIGIDSNVLEKVSQDIEQQEVP